MHTFVYIEIYVTVLVLKDENLKNYLRGCIKERTKVWFYFYFTMWNFLRLFYVLLTVHLSIILVINQLKAQKLVLQ